MTHVLFVGSDLAPLAENTELLRQDLKIQLNGVEKGFNGEMNDAVLPRNSWILSLNLLLL